LRELRKAYAARLRLPPHHVAHFFSRPAERPKRSPGAKNSRTCFKLLFITGLFRIYIPFCNPAKPEISEYVITGFAA